MTSNTARRFITIIMLLGITSAHRAAAQDRPQLLVGAGFVAVTDASMSWSGFVDRPALTGWHVDAGLPLSRRVTLVGEVDGSYGRQHGSGLLGSYVSTFSDTSYLGGVRFQAHPAKVVPFVQVLAGILRTREKQTYSTGPYGPYSFSNSLPVVQPGAGMDVMVNRRFGLRVAADLPFVPYVDYEGADSSLFRVVVGGIVPLGRK